ncbi:MAG: PEP-CTERM sorting domain-containing protein [Sedimentisphaerales bacterium]|nr:PEP-CTERM sorting domain-containing protein [Sedimentisphaerales bacterium]
MKIKASLLTTVAVLAIGGVACGALVDFDGQPFNGTINRDGQIVPTFLESEPVGAASAYQYNEEIYQNTSIAHTGAASNDPQIYQHIFAYSLEQSTAKYNVNNTTGHARTLIITPEECGRKEGSFLLTQSNIILDGMLLIAKPEGGDYKGLKATFNVQVNWEFDAWGLLNRTISIPVFRGTVNLFSLFNGKPFFYTTGNINRFLNVSSIEETPEYFRINFDEEAIPFRVLTRVGYEYTLTTKVTSNITTVGEGTGAEVEFGPGEPALPDFIEEHVVPEPTTFMSLTLGGVMMLGFKRFCRLRHVKH